MTQFADMSDCSVEPMRKVAMRFFCVRRRHRCTDDFRSTLPAHADGRRMVAALEQVDRTKHDDGDAHQNPDRALLDRFLADVTPYVATPAPRTGSSSLMP